MDNAQTNAVSPCDVIEPIGRNFNAFVRQFLPDAIKAFWHTKRHHSQINHLAVKVTLTSSGFVKVLLTNFVPLSSSVMKIAQRGLGTFAHAQKFQRVSALSAGR
jgi:hypothetical protein